MKSQGFSMIEMIVVTAVLGVVLLIAVAVFGSYHSHATASKIHKLVNEQVASTLGVIAADIRRAGTCLGYTHPELAMYWDTDELWINWAGYVDYDAIPSSPSSALPVNSVFDTNGWFDCQAGSFTIDKVSDTATIPTVSAGAFTGGDFGGILVAQTDSINATIVRAPIAAAMTLLSYGFGGTGECTVTATVPDNTVAKRRVVFGQGAGAWAGRWATPAIVYRRIPQATPGQLYRNWEVILGDPAVSSGQNRVGLKELRITAFTVVCNFQTLTDATPVTVASRPALAGSGRSMRNLKSVVVTLAYQWVESAKSEIPRRRSFINMEISPRSIVKSTVAAGG